MAPKPATKVAVKKPGDEAIQDGAIDAKTNAPLASWVGWIEKTRSHQVSALQAGGEKKRTKIPNARLAPARQAAVEMYEFGGGFSRARFGAGIEELYDEPESPREMLRRKAGYKVKGRQELGDVVNLRKAELAQAGGRGAAHLLQLEDLLDQADLQAEETESSEEENPTESGQHAMTGDQWKLLYLIGEYSSLSKNRKIKERWMPQIPLMVLMYEGIMAKIFGYDYSPNREIIGRKLVWLNWSQEGKNDIDTLRTRQFIFVLRATDANHIPIIAYQVSPEGRKVLESMPKQHARSVDRLVAAPRAMSKVKDINDQLMVHWINDQFILKSESGFNKLTKVCDTEDVSYVSSPHIPFYVRAKGPKRLSSNRGRAKESTFGITNIDADMKEWVKLDDITIVIAEWIPMGDNNMKTTCTKVGADERVSSGFYSSSIDMHPADTCLSVDPGLTNITVIDCLDGTHINLEAEIYFPEEEGIVQVENFGIHLDVTGSCFCSMRMEAIQERIRNNMSLDHMSRVLVDILQDSSRVMDTILSTRQRSMLELVYKGYSMNRPKFYLLFAEKINPVRPVMDYLDRDRQENELRQVLGEITGAQQITKYDCFIFGSNGILAAGPNRFQYEQLLCIYAYLNSRHMFIGSILLRMLAMMDELKKIREVIAEPKGDPNIIKTVHEQLSSLSYDSVFLEETMKYSNEALKRISLPRMHQQSEHEKTPRHVVHDMLKFKELMFDLERRSIDVSKHLLSVNAELWFVWRKSDDLYDRRLTMMMKDVDVNFRRMVGTMNANARQILEQYIVLQWLFCAYLAFEFGDRIVGNEWSVLGFPWIQNVMGFNLASLPMTNPIVWFIFAVIIFCVIVFRIDYIQLRKVKEHQVGWVTSKILLKQPINLDALDDFIASRTVISQRVQYSTDHAFIQCTWIEPLWSILRWKGYRPHITMEYDDDHGFVDSVFIHYNVSSGGLTPKELKDILLNSMVDANIMAPQEEKEEEVAGEQVI